MIARSETDQMYERYRSVRFFGSLNGLRFICIIAVMWHHSPARAALDSMTAPTWMLRGFLGVDFFFVLSGFLITTLLLREESRDGRFSLRGFYWRRILRIVPVYFLVVTLVAAWFIGVRGQSELISLLPYYYLFFSNVLIDDIPLLTITWSLSVEEQYYVLWPTILLFLPRVSRIWVLLVLILLCFLSAEGLLAWIGLQPIQTEHAVWRLPVSGLHAILIGSLAAMILHNRRGFDAVFRVLGHKSAPLLAFCLVFVVIQTTPGHLPGWPNLLVHGAMCLCLMTIVVREDHWLAKPFSWRPIARVGEISYGLYLYHLIGRDVGVRVTNLLDLHPTVAPWVATALFVPISIAFAELSFRTFERYFLGFKHAVPGRSN